ncbi:P-loop NTPase fold protein [Streptomyces chartreusis]|uniref:P-loop NTPase fold protein n=1 Tax=Streptomyces chartreusis TaxID=1969 RepID=UPI003D9103F0
MEKIGLLSDNAISGASGDAFGFLAHARVLCDALEGTDDLPLTVGIFGPWGMGKSSFLTPPPPEGAGFLAHLA